MFFLFLFLSVTVEPYCPPRGCTRTPFTMMPPKDASHNINLPCRSQRSTQAIPRSGLQQLLGMPMATSEPSQEETRTVCNRTENTPEPPKLSPCLIVAATSVFQHVES